MRRGQGRRPLTTATVCRSTYSPIVTLLDQIIEDAISDSASTANLLRKVVVVTHRLHATEVETWARAELDGYPSAPDALPSYRKGLEVPVSGEWSGRFGTKWSPVSPGLIPSPEREYMFTTHVAQSVDELEQLAGLDDDPGAFWDARLVVKYNEYVTQRIASGFAYETLIGARKITTRGALRGILGTVRTTALDFAVGLQMANPDAGSLNGPTVTEKGIASTIFHVTNNLYGAGTNVAQGSGITQSSTLTAGEIIGLLRAAQSAGLTDAAAARDLAAAATADESERQSMFDRVIEKVKAGTYTVATGVTTSTAAGVVEEAIKAYLGLS